MLRSSRTLLPIRRKPYRARRKPSILTQDWIRSWYKEFKEPRHAVTTRQVQTVYIEKHIIPYLGHYPLSELTTPIIQAFFNHLQKAGNQSRLKHVTPPNPGLASWTVKKIRALLMSALEAAIKFNHITTNPVRKTEPIVVKTLTVAPFTEEQQRIFLAGTRRHRHHLAYRLLFYTGCRRSEILGLIWDNVNLGKREIYIRKVLVCVDGAPILRDYPKTKASIRSIPLHPDLCEALEAHRVMQQAEKDKAGDNWQKHGLVFCNADGSPHSPTYFLHNFKMAIRKLGLPRLLRIHSTRHTFATNLLQQGTAIVDVQKLGGWSDTRVVLDIYAHAVQESQRSAVEQLYSNHQQPN